VAMLFRNDAGNTQELFFQSFDIIIADFIDEQATRHGKLEDLWSGG
jgi:hypothetical protein